MTNDRTKEIARLNDLARKGMGVRTYFSAGVMSLDRDREVLRKLRHYDAFDPSNDPYGEHDFGRFKVADEWIFWKIDYYDRTAKGASPDPANPNVTTRILTVFLAQEY